MPTNILKQLLVCILILSMPMICFAQEAKKNMASGYDKTAFPDNLDYHEDANADNEKIDDKPSAMLAETSVILKRAEHNFDIANFINY